MKIIQSDTKQTIINAVQKYTDMIVPTYGPAGKSVLIASNELSIKAADDGHAASAEIELENEFQNAVVLYIKEATEKTNSRVGDGTTTSVILTKAILDQVLLDDPFADTSYYKQVKEIQKATQEAVEFIKAKSKKIETVDELFKVAYNSYNNEKIARLIADTLFKIGSDGVLAIEDSRTAETEVEIVEGIELEKGYASPYFINADKESAVLNDQSVLLVHNKLDRFLDVVPLLKELFKDRKEFVIIADGFGEEFLGGMIMNKIQGTFSPLLIETPGFGDSKLESLKNISAVTGAKIFDPKTNKLSEATVSDMGSIKKVISKKDKSTLI